MEVVEVAQHATSRNSILGSQARLSGFGPPPEVQVGASFDTTSYPPGLSRPFSSFALASARVLNDALRGDTGRPGLTQRPAEMEAELVRLFLPEPSRLQVQDCA